MRKDLGEGADSVFAAVQGEGRIALCFGWQMRQMVCWDVGGIGEDDMEGGGGEGFAPIAVDEAGAGREILRGGVFLGCSQGLMREVYADALGFGHFAQ